MGSKKIYLIRHGETEYNRRGVVQGSGIDAPLNETGQRQAHAFYKAFKEVKFDKVYYTGLQRTRQSVAGFLETLKLPSESVPELNEISWGDFEGVPMTEERDYFYQNMVKRWAEGELDYVIAGGESPNMVAERLQRGIDHILAQPFETILICMHGRAMRILLSLMMETDISQMDQYKHQNLGLYLLEGEKGNFELLKVNDGEHLQVLNG